MTEIIREAVQNISRALYPEICPMCGITIDGKRALICSECTIKLVPVKPPLCLKCGKEVEDEETACCKDCSSMSRSFIKGMPALNYNDHMAKCLSEFKYHNMRCYVKLLADIIVKNRGKEILLAAPEVIVPVPIHKSKLKERGYNQAELLSIELSRRLKLPIDTGLILRDEKTAPQKGLSNQEREENLKRAFISSGKIVKYKSALIVDDIYTTGATVEACTSVLQSMGIKDIYYTSVCVGKGY